METLEVHEQDARPRTDGAVPVGMGGPVSDTIHSTATQRGHASSVNSAVPTSRTSTRENVGTSVGSKKKKGRRKIGDSALHFQVDLPSPPTEAQAEVEYWARELRRGRSAVDIPYSGILTSSFKPHLPLLLTPSCSALSLSTPRLNLRPVQPEDLPAIKRIKLEPSVQRTQLYGSPHESVIRDAFLERYVRSSMPRVMGGDNNGRCRELYCFAITLKEPGSVQVRDGGNLRAGSRIQDAEGYIGNIALSLSCSDTANLLPRRRRICTQSTFDQTASAELTGTMFFEIHPQLWGKRIISEAFKEVVRFAMEEVGCMELSCDPLKGNEACIRLCVANGFRYTHTSRDNPYQKPQAWHKVTRREWWVRNRPNEAIKGKHDGRLLCRWCMRPQEAIPAYRCAGCDWALYCSRECQRADWVYEEGHQVECDHKARS